MEKEAKEAKLKKMKEEKEKMMQAKDKQLSQVKAQAGNVFDMDEDDVSID